MTVRSTARDHHPRRRRLAPPFDTFNLGDHVGDDPAAVAANRKRLAAAIGLGDDGVVWMNQVHGDRVVVSRRPE